MEHIPTDVVIAGVYVPPLLVATCLGGLAAFLTAWLLNRTRLARFFFAPPLVFAAMTVLYTGLIGTFVIEV